MANDELPLVSDGSASPSASSGVLDKSRSAAQANGKGKPAKKPAEPLPDEVADESLDDVDEGGEPEAHGSHFFNRKLWEGTGSIFVSMVVHAVILILLATVQFSTQLEQ